MCAVLDRQGGGVLVAALLILLVTGVLATSVLETNTMQLRMAGNEQARKEVLQELLSIIDGVIARRGNFSPRVGPGYRICPAGREHMACDRATLVIDEQVTAGPVGVDYYVQRMGPAELPLPVMPENRASSGRHYRAVLFEVSASVAAGNRRAGANASQGVLLRVVAGHRSGVQW